MLPNGNVFYAGSGNGWRTQHNHKHLVRHNRDHETHIWPFIRRIGPAAVVARRQLSWSRHDLRRRQLSNRDDGDHRAAGGWASLGIRPADVAGTNPIEHNDCFASGRILVTGGSSVDEVAANASLNTNTQSRDQHV